MSCYCKASVNIVLIRVIFPGFPRFLLKTRSRDMAHSWRPRYTMAGFRFSMVSYGFYTFYFRRLSEHSDYYVRLWCVYKHTMKRAKNVLIKLTHRMFAKLSCGFETRVLNSSSVENSRCCFALFKLQFRPRSLLRRWLIVPRHSMNCFASAALSKVQLHLY